jgi:hypothetical protein
MGLVLDSFFRSKVAQVPEHVVALEQSQTQDNDGG